MVPEKSMKNKRKYIIIVSAVIIGIAAALAAFWYFFCSMKHLPEGEYLKSSVSPEGTYKIKAYVSCTSLSSDAVRCEVQNTDTGKTKNVYWEYRKSDADISWVDDETVIINGRMLNVTSDKYDWRKDDAFEISEDEINELKESVAFKTVSMCGIQMQIPEDNAVTNDSADYKEYIDNSGSESSVKCIMLSCFEDDTVQELQASATDSLAEILKQNKSFRNAASQKITLGAVEGYRIQYLEDGDTYSALIVLPAGDGAVTISIYTKSAVMLEEIIDSIEVQ